MVKDKLYVHPHFRDWNLLQVWETEEWDYDRLACPLVGSVRVEIINYDNVVITVERGDRSKFGPVSLVVV